MLEDRDYMRRSSNEPRTPRTVLLAILNAIAVRARQIVHWPWTRWKYLSRRAASREPDGDVSTDEFLQTEVDPILDKISAHGIQSLTERERKILEKARAKMTKR